MASLKAKPDKKRYYPVREPPIWRLYIGNSNWINLPNLTHVLSQIQQRGKPERIEIAEGCALIVTPDDCDTAHINNDCLMKAEMVMNDRPRSMRSEQGAGIPKDPVEHWEAAFNHFARDQGVTLRWPEQHQINDRGRRVYTPPAESPWLHLVPQTSRMRLAYGPLHNLGHARVPLMPEDETQSIDATSAASILSGRATPTPTHVPEYKGGEEDLPMLSANESELPGKSTLGQALHFQLPSSNAFWEAYPMGTSSDMSAGHYAQLSRPHLVEAVHGPRPYPPPQHRPRHLALQTHEKPSDNAHMLQALHANHQVQYPFTSHSNVVSTPATRIPQPRSYQRYHSTLSMADDEHGVMEEPLNSHSEDTHQMEFNRHVSQQEQTRADVSEMNKRTDYSLTDDN
ncbi:hypothetical protein BZG36_02130 [Bifiguratus adelaidae]|uniref:Uncharacterized protein n=1 Tax=Bifiguratus adelaidae TaxID=1938954 RepID=A0A261Y355_9FUNG|nr:hypothetical protein BZG36_02130 [Bifiguratus adelaidae]